LHLWKTYVMMMMMMMMIKMYISIGMDEILNKI
jgi:hypothetical protein